MNSISFLFSTLALALMAMPHSVGAAEPNTWITIFDERFADNPRGRFEEVPMLVPHVKSSSAYDAEHKALSVSGYLTLVRPVSAGAASAFGSSAPI